MKKLERCQNNKEELLSSTVYNVLQGTSPKFAEVRKHGEQVILKK